MVEYINEEHEECSNDLCERKYLGVENVADICEIFLRTCKTDQMLAKKHFETTS